MSKDPIHPLFKKAKKATAGDDNTSSSSPNKAKVKKAKKAKSATGKAAKRSRSRSGSTKRAAGPPAGTQRIQKVLARAGVDSRRACEQMVAEGRISVNGKEIKSLPCFVTAEDAIAIDGQKIRVDAEKKVYILLNKPAGVYCTNAEDLDKPRAIDLVSHVAQRVFPVGRLDADSTGLIILTNDGEFANRIAHPRYGVSKTYVVEVDGRVEGEDMEKLKRGMHLDGKRAKASGVKVLQRGKKRTLLEIRLNEGRNREIRRLLARLDFKVRALRRVAIGPVDDFGIKTGKCRLLTPDEVSKLVESSSG